MCTHGQKFFREAKGNRHLDRRYAGRAPPQGVMPRLLEIYGDLLKLLGTDRRHPRPILMHGSLIGWRHGEAPLPWDDDIDVSFMGDDIQAVKELDGRGIGDCVLEVNPNSEHRCHRDRENVIDARMICKRTGLFVDITFLTPDGSAVTCKSPHPYERSWILPLQPGVFSGMAAFIPRDVRSVLVSEYGIQVMRPYYGRWRFSEGRWEACESEREAKGCPRSREVATTRVSVEGLDPKVNRYLALRRIYG